jgi:hypothetical protein
MHITAAPPSRTGIGSRLKKARNILIHARRKQGSITNPQSIRTATRTTACDLNGNQLLDGPEELGAFNSTQGGGGGVRVDRNLIRPTGNELSVNLEREIKSGLSGRASYVYKNQRNLWGEYDTIRGPLYTVPFTINDPGPDNNLATLEDNQTLEDAEVIQHVIRQSFGRLRGCYELGLQRRPEC